MKTKYYNDAIIGNKNVRATLSKKGELLRLYYPSIDYRQFIDELIVGLKVNDSRLINLYDDINNIYNQNYVEDTNILNTEMRKLKATQTVEKSKNNILTKKIEQLTKELKDIKESGGDDKSEQPTSGIDTSKLKSQVLAILKPRLVKLKDNELVVIADNRKAVEAKDKLKLAIVAVITVISGQSAYTSFFEKSSR